MAFTKEEEKLIREMMMDYLCDRMANIVNEFTKEYFNEIRNKGKQDEQQK